MRKNLLDHERPPTALQLERETLLRLCEDFPSPRAVTIFMMADSGQWQDLVDLTINDEHYLEHETDRFRSDYLLTSFLGKSPNLPLKVDKRLKALEKFKQSESRCRTTNDELYERIANLPARTRKLLAVAKTRIHRILGPITYEVLDRKIMPLCGFGPGSTLSVSGSDVCMTEKYSGKTKTATTATLNFFLFDNSQGLHSMVKDLLVVEGNRLSFVSKNAKTDRAICIEPDLNIWYQRGFGQYIRSRLKLFGVNLNSQYRNQWLASMAYKFGLATLDLASASDTIAVRVVEYLLPSAWVTILSMFRCPKTLVDGEWLEMEKWSSMGNGYTFELETLIFHALLYAVREMNEDPKLGNDIEGYDDGSRTFIGTYGDDLIIDQRYYDETVHILELLGFEVNEAKSFGKGCFFESCGKDYFCGTDVRPFFARRKYGKTSDAEHAIYAAQLANRLSAWCTGRYAGVQRDRRGLRTFDWLQESVKPELRFRVPYGYEGGFHSALDAACPNYNRRKGHWRFRELSEESPKRPGGELALYRAALNGQYTSRDTQEDLVRYGHIETVRGKVKVTTKNRTTISWDGPGPWA